MIRSLVRRYYGRILLALSLVVVENLAWIAEPTVFGNVIDAFIDRTSLSSPELLGPLALWIAVFLVNSGTGALRRAVDQRIYLTMFGSIAVDVARTASDRGDSLSRTVARTELSREFIGFFQYRVPEILEQSIAIGGAVVALFFFDWRISLSCLFIVLPLFLVTRFYVRRVANLQTELHDTREELVDIFATRDTGKIAAYYRRITRAEQRIANWGALNFAVIRVCLLAIFLIVLYISIDLDDFTTGNIYSIVAYLWTFVTSTEYLPELLESSTSIRDISRRLDTDDSAPNDD